MIWIVIMAISFIGFAVGLILRNSGEYAGDVVPPRQRVGELAIVTSFLIFTAAAMFYIRYK